MKKYLYINSRWVLNKITVLNLSWTSHISKGYNVLKIQKRALRKSTRNTFCDVMKTCFLRILTQMLKNYDITKYISTMAYYNIWDESMECSIRDVTMETCFSVVKYLFPCRRYGNNSFCIHLIEIWSHFH